MSATAEPMGRSFRILDGVETAMRDGVVLRADVWLPDGAGPWPVLLQRTPYRREAVHGAQFISALEFQSALRRGFAVVVQDTRGRYGSDGAFDPFVNEGRDGADTIAWLRGQDFCDGRVAMFGASYVGATQVLAAAEDPEGLVAISPQLTTARHGETWTYRGGAVELGFVLLWIIEALGLPDLAARLGHEDAARLERAGAHLAALQTDPAAAFARLPALEEDLVALAPYAARWLDNARAEGAAAEREHLDALGAARPAMLVTGGLNDLFAEGSVELYETAAARGTGRDRLILGPWSHGNPSDWQGQRWHGYAASTALLSDVQLDFFAAAFEGRADPAPVVRYFRTGSDSWHAAPAWPLPGVATTAFHLDGDALSEAPAPAPWQRGWTSDTLDPVPTRGGATFLPGLLQGLNSGPLDQSGVEARGDVLVFTSPPLNAPIEVTGLVQAELFVTASGRSADWTARLCVVSPDGVSRGLVDGILRVPDMSALDPDAPVTMRLGHVSHLFAAGDRLRLQVASSNFPRFDRNPQSGVPSMTAVPADFTIAQHALHGGPSRPSRLVLPVVTEPFPEIPGLA